MIQALIAEPEKSVKNGIAQLLGLLGKFEFADNTWPELLQFIYSLCGSDNMYDNELGMYTLSIMTEMSQGSYINHADDLSVLFTNVLNALQDSNSNLAYYTIMTMNNLVPTIAGHQKMINVYHNLLPRILEIINSFSSVDEKRGVDVLGLLEELIEYAIAVIVPHVSTITEMCLRIGSDNSLPTAIQIKAISIVGWLVRSKGKVIQKHKLVEPIINVLMELMAQKPENEDEEFFVGDPDQFTTITIATQTLDLIALNIPADKVVNHILSKVETTIQSNDVYAQKAAYLCLAVLAEGCSECIRHKYLESFLKCVCGALRNPNNMVRNAAFFALGQFAEHLQPEISQYASELLPVLFDYLNQIYIQMEKEKIEPNSLDKLFYALETFCENLDEELMPYLPVLMEKLFMGLDPRGWSMQLKRVVLSTLGSATSAVKSGMQPYFPKIIEMLNVYINADPKSELHELQSDAIECLAVVAQFIGVENFKPLAQDTLQLALRILDSTDDPDVKGKVYALLASLSIIMKEEIAPALPKVVEQMILSIQSSEGITYSEDDKKEDYDVYGELSSDEETADEEDLYSTDSDESGQCRFSVENAYNEEKEQACLTLKEICAQIGHGFLPYIEKSFEEIFKLVDYPQENIRKTSLDALLQFCLTLHKVNTSETKQALQKTLEMFIPKCGELIRTDEERSVVVGALDCYALLLKEVKGEAFVAEGHREAIMNCVIDVLTHKTMCQDTDVSVLNSLESIGETTDTEQDELLLESACDIIPKYGEAIKPDDFVLYFPNILQLLTVRTIKQNSIAQRSFAYGTLAECMKCLDVYVETFVPQLLQIWLTGLKDSADEVRNNSVFGLGEMILHGKDKIFRYYGDILSELASAVSRETHAGTLDNICGALAKMIITNCNEIPLGQVFPAFLQHLPLRDDFQENEAVIKCFCLLYQNGNPVIRENIETVSKVSIHILTKDQTPNDKTRNILHTLLKSIRQDFVSEFNSIASQLDLKSMEILHQVLNQ
ncbi:hypothetical protein WA026_020178 [Henosepilachna vigintioctopunctata]|uniref:IPO4/5-like TPR repeats domain-containing protein n=1 Tax=Henosepilachna vigintioctopunctata TaxID=420089 RepID=A0AAW1U612_9CUCU